jgi:hypothetical protein
MSQQYLAEMRKLAESCKQNDVMVSVHPDVLLALLDEIEQVREFFAPLADWEWDE